MAHAFQSDWHFYYLEINSATGASTWVSKDILHLTNVTNDGKVIAGRDDQGRTFTGQATRDGSSLVLDRSDGVHFEGLKVFDKMITGRPVTVVSGTKGDASFADKGGPRPKAQDDGIWVITKP